MAAVQLFKGEHEPFLGMGAADGIGGRLALERRRAGRPGRYADVDTAYPEHGRGSVPVRETGRRPAAAPHGSPAPRVRHGLGGRQPAVRPEPCLAGSQPPGQGVRQPDDPPADARSSSRPQGGWTDGRWTVVLRRPLAGPARRRAWRWRRAIASRSPSPSGTARRTTATGRSSSRSGTTWTWNNQARPDGRVDRWIRRARR